jgi:hypothetical protein
VQVALGKGDFDSSRLEAAGNPLTKGAPNGEQISHIGNPAVQFELQGAVSETKKKRIGLRAALDSRLGFSGFLQQA